LPAGITHLLISTPPDPAKPRDAAMDLLEQDGGPLPASVQWLGYLSATSVYGDHQGAWVEETSALNAASARSVARMEAERLWLARGAEVFRLAGIYGPGRSVFGRLKAGQARIVTGTDTVFSRIHVQDIAGAVCHAIAQPQPRRILNLADDLPASPNDLVHAAAEMMGIKAPTPVDIAQADLSTMAASFWADSKRVSNKRLTGAFGYQMRYPTWREGLAHIWESSKKLHK
jgi:nucleoside-diphosphate-sugar epimerase